MPPPATFGGFSEFSAPQQMVTGSPDLISGRVADPAGDRVDAIHVYRDLDGDGVLDPGSDGLLHADTTPADGYAFHAGSLPSGSHVLYVALSVVSFAASVANRNPWGAAAAGLQFFGIKLHSFPSILDGLLVTESSLGRIQIDMLGYTEYF